MYLALAMIREMLDVTALHPSFQKLIMPHDFWVLAAANAVAQ